MIGFRLRRSLVRCLVRLLPFCFLLLSGCAPQVRYKALVDLRHQYDGILEEWRGALDEPELEQELKTRYLRLQSVCRRLKRSPYAMTFEARAQCEVVELPFSACLLYTSDAADE